MKSMTQLLIISFFISIFFNCENPKETDTTPPSVTIISPQDGATVSEIVSITCVSTDNEGVQKVELWVDGVSTAVIDNNEPYSLEWNTTTYKDGSSHTITVRAYDNNNNKTDSNPILLIVDNSNSFPNAVNIEQIIYDMSRFNIVWNQSKDVDFHLYELEKSLDSSMISFTVLYTTDIVTDTIYIDSNINPLIYQYYRMSVVDSLGYKTKGDIFASTLDPKPIPVNILSVNYTSNEMTVIWEKSPDIDFMNYKLLYSETLTGIKDTIAIYSDKSTTSHVITNADTTHENWFWIIVTDSLGQSSLGNGMIYLITGIVTDIDGNVYKTVKIGNQWWMAENLIVTHYQNGDSLPEVTYPWDNLTTGAYCNYNNDISNVSVYGRLYNWYAVNDNRGIAPVGWHIPSDNEWKDLEIYLGMSQFDADAENWRGTDEGGKVKEAGMIHWSSPNLGATNSSGFTALPGGYRNPTFGWMDYHGAYWSATEYNQTRSWYRILHYAYSQVFRNNSNKTSGFSIRCVRD